MLVTLTRHCIRSHCSAYGNLEVIDPHVYSQAFELLTAMTTSPACHVRAGTTAARATMRSDIAHLTSLRHGRCGLANLRVELLGLLLCEVSRHAHGPRAAALWHTDSRSYSSCQSPC